MCFSSSLKLSVVATSLKYVSLLVLSVSSQWQEELRASEAEHSRQLQDIQKELTSAHLKVSTYISLTPDMALL